MNESHALATADWIVLAAYILLVVGLGWLARSSQSDSGHFFLGGRSLPWPLVGMSILATAFSATSLLGGPGEAWSNGMLWIQLQLGDLLAIVVVALLFIPFFRGLSLTTAYEYLERRFGVSSRSLASLLFQGQVLLRAGILVFGPALALSTLTGIELEWAILSVGIVATAYTLMGGIKAVIWTDVLQLVVVLAGLGGCFLVLAGEMEGGLIGGLREAAAAGKLQVFDGEQNWNSVRSLMGAVFGYGILSLSVAGTNQQPVQRYLSCRSVNDARRAAFLGWGVGAFVTVLTLLLGILLFVHYGGERPGDLAADALFPHFIASSLPAGLSGLLVAAIFAAAMSSLDSALNSLATASVVDLHSRLRPADAQSELARARLHTLMWGIAATLAGLWVAQRPGGLLADAVRYMGWFAGPMLGLFLLGFLMPRANEKGVLCGLGLSYAIVLGSAFLPGLPNFGIWTSAIGALAMVLCGGGASLFWPAPSDSQLDGLCWERRELSDAAPLH